MDSAAPTRTKPTTAATPHPFNGDFKSTKISEILDEDDDGTFHFDISPGGDFISGTHTPAGGTPQTLKRVILNRRVIKVSVQGQGDVRFWHGSIISLLGDPQNPLKKVVVGRYHIPGNAADEEAGTDAGGQDNGIWVATQP